MTREEIAAAATQYTWFGAVRCLDADAGTPTPEAYLLARRKRLELSSRLKAVKFETAEKDPTIAVIDEFISKGEYRITVDPSTPDDMAIENRNNDSDDFVSEDLARIYSSQGLFDAAEEIYRKLSLQEPKKSIYFAELIETLERQRAEQPPQVLKSSEENN